MAFKREAVIKTAEKYVSKGKVEAAIKEYRKILQKAPNDISSLNRVGDLYARIQKIDDAVGLFEQIADRYTDDGFFPKAIAIYKKILKLDPRRLDAYQSLAELYQKQGLANDARAQYQVLAAYYQKHGDLPKAIGVCQKMSALEPDNPSHHVKLADLYRESGQNSEALEAYSTIAGLMMKHGHVGEAAQVYHRALDLGAGDLDFVRRAVTALKDAGDSDAALKLVHAAGEVNPAASGLAGQIGLSEAPPPTPVASPVAEPMPSAPPPPIRPPVAVPEPAPEFDIDESFGGLEEAPSTQVQPPADLGEGPPEMDDLAIDIGGGVGAAADIPLEIDWSEMPSLEVESEEFEVAPAAPELAPQPPPAEIVPPVVEQAAPVRKTEDLLAEAEVFSKYGLAQKALDRFQEILDQDRDCLAAHRLRMGVLIQQGDRPAIEEAAQRMREVSERLGESAEWEEMQVRLVEGGFVVGPVAPEGAPELEVAPVEPVMEPLEEIALEEVAPIEEFPELEPELEPETEVEAVAEVAADLEEPPAEIDEELPELELPELEPVAEVEAGEDEGPEDLEVELPAPLPVEPVPSVTDLNLDAGAPKDVRAKRPKPSRGIDAALAEITAEILQPSRKIRPKKAAVHPVESVPPPAELPTPPPEPVPVEVVAEPEIMEPADMSLADALDESGMDWLDEVAASDAEAEAAGEKLFDDEDDFFDLAAELQDELGSDDDLAAIGEPEEQSLEEIVEGFKKGVSEALSEEDVDTHYNLGIAYREMGLVDEAIGEFQLAAKDPGYLVNCCAMLGVCFVEKGLPELAVKWYQRALDHPGLEEEEYLGLMYDLGAAQVSMGEHTAAHETFVEIYGVNSNYRDVSDRMQEAASAAGA